MTRRSSKPATVKRGGGGKQGLPYDTLGLDAESLKKAMLGHLEFTLAELPRHVDTEWEPYVALALAVRDRMTPRWLHTQDTYYERDVKRVYWSNPDLARLITEAVGGWVTDLDQLEQLVPLAQDRAFGVAWRKAKRGGKIRLAETIRRQYDPRGFALDVDPDSLFDIQVKRIHEYKRQLLNVLHVITLYNLA